MSYSIGIWEDDSTRIWSGVYNDAGLDGFSVTSGPDPDVLLRTLLDGSLDVALLPPNVVLANIRDLDILPAVCITATENPFARVSLDSVENNTPLELSASRGKSLFKLVGEIVLKEHYNILTLGKDDSERDSEIESRQTLVSPSPVDGGFILDLTREWHELVSYPLVCALFVTRRKHATREMITAVRDVTLQVDIQKGSWIAVQELNPDQSRFFASQLGFRLDDMAVASLSDLCEYMYYYGVTKEIPTFTLASIGEVDQA